MSDDRPAPKPRTFADVLADVLKAFDEAKHPRRPLPMPPADAPTPPPSHHDREPGDDQP